MQTVTNSSNSAQNKQISDRDLAYAAGIVDGEGCISIVALRTGVRAHGVDYSLLFVVRMIDPSAVFFLKEMFGGGLSVQKNKPPRRPIYNWGLSTKPASRALKLLLPYLRVKKKQAELAIEFANYPQQIHPISKAEFDRRTRLFQQLRQLNKRGC